MSAVRLERLTVEHATAPVGVGGAPRFGWVVVTDVDGVRQTAWTLVVTAPDGSEWRTGAADEACVDIPYDGPALAPLVRHAWRVEVETTAGRAVAGSTFVTALTDGDWRGARWIGGPPESVPAPLLRAEFELADEPSEAYLVVAAGGYARVELDGAPVDDALLSPGFTDYDVTAQYTVTDLAGRLAAGRHALGAELGRGFYGMLGRNTWNWETAPWHDEPCARILLLLRFADGSERVVASGPDWRTVAGPTRTDDLYAGEDHDARADPVGWSRGGFDDAAWMPAREARGPRGSLVPQRQPPIVVAERLEPTGMTQLEPGRWVVSFPRVLAGWVEVETDGEAGDVVDLRFGEVLRADGTPNSDDEKGYFDGRFQCDTLTLAGGPIRWRPRFTWHGFQHVEVRAARLPRLVAEVVRTRAPRTGSFASTEPLLDTVHELTVQTVLMNLHGLPTDTPKYEKNGWTGDGMLGARLMLQNLDVHELLAKWSADIAASRHGEGAPEVIAPHGGWTMDWTPAPTWHAALVLVPWEIHLQRGDRRVLEEAWPDIRDYLRFELGRWPTGLADTTLGDWVSPETDAGGGNAPEDTRVAATAFLVAMCDTAARIAETLGEPADEWRAAAARSRAAFVAEFWDAAAAVVRGIGDEGYRQAHTVLALAHGLLPAADRQRAADRLARDVRERGDRLGTGALATKYLLPVLTEAGHADVALAVARQTGFPSWGYWVERGATSLWEHWKEESRSRGHYFLGTLDDWLYAHVAGLEPLAPGWRRALIAPRVPGIEEASASVETPYGRLAVAWRRSADAIELDAEVPVGVTAELRLDGIRRELGPGRHTVAAPAHQAE